MNAFAYQKKTTQRIHFFDHYCDRGFYNIYKYILTVGFLCQHQHEQLRNSV